METNINIPEHIRQQAEEADRELAAGNAAVAAAPPPVADVAPDAPPATLVDAAPPPTPSSAPAPAPAAKVDAPVQTADEVAELRKQLAAQEHKAKTLQGMLAKSEAEKVRAENAILKEMLAARQTATPAPAKPEPPAEPKEFQTLRETLADPDAAEAMIAAVKAGKVNVPVEADPAVAALQKELAEVRQAQATTEQQRWYEAATAGDMRVAGVIDASIARDAEQVQWEAEPDPNQPAFARHEVIARLSRTPAKLREYLLANHPALKQAAPAAAPAKPAATDPVLSQVMPSSTGAKVPTTAGPQTWTMKQYTAGMTVATKQLQDAQARGDVSAQRAASQLVARWDAALDRGLITD